MGEGPPRRGRERERRGREGERRGWKGWGKGREGEGLLRTKILATALPSGYIFQQDGAPAHTARATHNWLQTNYPDFIAKD